MLTLLFALLCGFAHAQHETIWDVHARKFISLDEMTSAPGDIFVVGEEHAVEGQENDPETTLHHANQVRLIRKLQTQNVVSVGMEFLTYTFQDLVARFVAGVLPEADFLSQAHWGSSPFQFYRGQILAPRGTAGETVALNIPMEIANQVAKRGKDSLTDAQRNLLPPVWERGNDAYFARFAEEMKDHAPADAIERYFWAQSLWDDTMAWRAREHQSRLPGDVLVIIVGEFHVQFGGGLPFELKQHGAQHVKTLLQIAVPDMEPATLAAAITPDDKYGYAADYLWMHQNPLAKPCSVNKTSSKMAGCNSLFLF